jgi:hypothetical protein
MYSPYETRRESPSGHRPLPRSEPA